MHIIKHNILKLIILMILNVNIVKVIIFHKLILIMLIYRIMI